jgi:hypothetical protein
LTAAPAHQQKQGKLLQSDCHRRFFSQVSNAVNRRFQRWLKSCKQAFHSCEEVNNRNLQFDDLINKVLNGTFHMIHPPTFEKVQGTASSVSNINKEVKK